MYIYIYNYIYIRVIIKVQAFKKHTDAALNSGLKDAYASAGVAAVTQ